MHPDAALAQTTAIRAMSVEQKLRVAEALRAFAWDLKRAAIRRQHPDLGDGEVLQRVRATFGHDSGP